MLAVIVALTLSLFFFPQSGVAGGKCENFLSSRDPLQEKIQKHDSRIRDLIYKYRQKLGFYHDAFAMVWTPEQGDRVFRRLSVRLKDGKWMKSPLFVVNQQLKHAYVGKSSYDEGLVQWIIDDATYLLKQSQVDRVDLQSNLLALKYATEYLRRFKEPEIVVDRDGKKAGEKARDPKQKKSKRSQKSEEDQPPEYPDLPKEYKPSIIDTQSQSNGKQKNHRVAEVNFKVPFFAQRHFSDVVREAAHPFKEVALPFTFSQPAGFMQTGKEMIVRTFGKKKVDLFLPPGFKPLQPSDPRAVISRLETGGYSLELKDDLAEIHIPLIEDTDILLLLHLQEIYARPVGFKIEEWPDLIQAEIIRRFSKEDAKSQPLKIAQAVSSHIASEYLYSVGPRSETDPIQAFQAGAFQCDMAAFAMVGILRDVYQIPSRVVGGFKGKTYLSGKDGKSYLVIPGEAHAWVEVFSDGKWHAFDPTPIGKDKKNNQKGTSEYSDITFEDVSEFKNEEEKGELLLPRPQEDRKKKQDHKARLDKNTQKRIKKADKKQKSIDKKKNQADEDQLTLEELANQLELGSLELEPKIDRNALLERVMRILLRTALDPTQRGIDIQDRLSQIYSFLKRFSFSNIKQIYQEGLSAHSNDHPGLKNWIDRLVRMMSEQDVNKTYQELHKIIFALEAYSKTLDRDGKIQIPEELLEILDLAKKEIYKLAHPSSQDIGLVQDLQKNLPSVARLLLKQLFGLSTVGPNAPTRKVAKELKKGKLNDLRLLSILSPLSDFILNSTPRPEGIEIKTWQRDLRRPMGKDLLPLQRFSDMTRALLGQPGKIIEENIQDGTAYVAVRRQRVQISAGHGKEEAERITIVLYDTSGSMDGKPGRFQAGLISAFTAKALSDVSRGGHHRHKVVLVSFDDVPGAPIPVTNTAEALDVIRNYQSKLKNTRGGTNIQKALLQAMSLIADAEKKSGEPLAAANIVLMTDGQAEINTAELFRARKAIDRQTPLQTMFIAINQTNEELIRFAMDSQKIGAERGFYREFTSEHINDILNEADHLNLKGRNDFYTDKSANDLSEEVYYLLDQSLSLAAKFSDQIYYGNQYVPARDHLEELEKLKLRNIPQIERPLERWLIKVRRFVRHPVFQDQRLLERVVDDLVTHFEQLTGIKKGSLSDYEQEQLKHLVRFAARLKEESK